MIKQNIAKYSSSKVRFMATEIIAYSMGPSFNYDILTLREVLCNYYFKKFNFDQVQKLINLNETLTTKFAKFSCL